MVRRATRPNRATRRSSPSSPPSQRSGTGSCGRTSIRELIPGEAFTGLFDRFEYLLSLAYADLAAGPTVGETTWAPIGSYAWRHRWDDEEGFRNRISVGPARPKMDLTAGDSSPGPYSRGTLTAFSRSSAPSIRSSTARRFIRRLLDAVPAVVCVWSVRRVPRLAVGNESGYFQGVRHAPGRIRTSDPRIRSPLLFH
jgi:hypothetical protein